MDERQLEEIITNVMHHLGIPAHIKGYYYLRSSILETIERPEHVTSVTKLLYPCISKKFPTTPKKLERSMRNAIQLSWERGDTSLQEKLFGYSRIDNSIRPTNSEFIAVVADSIRLQLM